jgi:hypothetical protein
MLQRTASNQKKGRPPIKLHKPINPLQALWPIESSQFWEGVGRESPALLDYEWHIELLDDLIFCPLDIHNHNQLSLVYTPLK